MARSDGNTPIPTGYARRKAWLQISARLVTSPGSMTGRDVKALREALGLSQRDFAKILKVSHMMIQRAETNGPKRPLVLYIERALAEGLLKVSDRKIEPEGKE